MKQILRALSTVVALWLFCGSVVSAQEQFNASKTGSLGARLGGGVSWSFGSSFENVGANEINLIQPIVEVGMIYNILPWVRIGIDYSFTQMVREQLFSSLQPDNSAGTLPGSVRGAAYRDFMSRFHGASLTGEFNLIGLSGNGSGRLSLYAGTGVGCLYATGNTWTLSVANEMRSDTWTNTVSFSGHNDSHSYKTLFIPVSLTLEYSFLPQVALSLGGGYDYIPKKTDIAPSSQVYAKAGLVFNFK